MSDQAAPEPVAPADPALDHEPESAVVPDEPPAADPTPGVPEVVAAEPAADVVEPEPAQSAELLDYREPENVLARGNIVSDGPGTVGA